MTLHERQENNIKNHLLICKLAGILTELKRLREIQ
jgi:hypothetical protein